MTEETERNPPEIPADFAELAELCGTTPTQTAFAKCLLEGDNFTAAAWRAGYAGARDSVNLRTAGSQAARAKPVQALLALAESKGLGVPDAPGDRNELKRLLWKHARSADKAHSIKASSELLRLEAEERAVDTVQIGPLEALKQIAEINPLMALLIYEDSGINHTKFELTPEQEATANILREKIAREYLNKVRSQAIASGQNVID